MTVHRDRSKEPTTTEIRIIGAMMVAVSAVILILHPR